MDEFYVSPDEGFSKRDTFGYKDYAAHLTSMVKRIPTPYTMMIDGPWGSGKTVFVKQWAGEMRMAGIPVIYFDAFSHDFAEDPYVALVGAILAELDRVNPKSTVRKSILEKGASLGRAVIPQLGKALVKGVVTKLIPKEDAENIGESIVAEITDVAGNTVEESLRNAFEEAAKQRDSIDAFKNELKNGINDLNIIYADKIDSVEYGDKENKRLVLIVDDLDRCRPSFAVSLLERLKHLFSVDGIVFVLVTHASQLQAAVRGVYGSGMDAENYLEKFFNISLSIPYGKNRKNNGKYIPESYIWELLVSAYGSDHPCANGNMGEDICRLARLIFPYESKRALNRSIGALAVITYNLRNDDGDELFYVIPAVFLKYGKADIYKNLLLSIHEGSGLGDVVRYFNDLDGNYLLLPQWINLWTNENSLWIKEKPSFRSQKVFDVRNAVALIESLDPS